MDIEEIDPRSVSRRRVVKGAGAAAAGAFAIASVPAVAQAAAASNAATAAPGPVDHAVQAAGDAGAFLVHVRDVRDGHLDVFVGDRHVPVQDRDLAARIAAAAR